jgi:GMP synthase-like glutamine amidotransferase
MANALFLRHHVEDLPGLIGEAFESRGIAIRDVMFTEGTTTPHLDGVDYLVILGSKSAVYDHEVEAAWFGRELALIADAHHRGIPILGICFGAQALCRHFGGVVSRAPEHEIGWFDLEIEPGQTLPAGPWFEYHFDEMTLPEGAELWARSQRCVQAFAVHNHVGVQFHPELDDAQLQRWLDDDGESARELGVDLEALMEKTKAEMPAARERALALVDLFFDRQN